MGHHPGAGEQHRHRRVPGLHGQPGDQRRRLPRRGRRQRPGACAGLQPSGALPDPRRDHHEVRAPDGYRDQRFGQAGGGATRRRDPGLPSAGAVQGQGRQVRDRDHPS